MKQALIIAIVGVALAGCTGVTKKPDGTVSYRNGIFQKTFSELEYNEERSTNGAAKVVVKVKGYQSEAAGLVKAAAEGVANGLKP